MVQCISPMNGRLEMNNVPIDPNEILGTPSTNDNVSGINEEFWLPKMPKMSLATTRKGIPLHLHQTKF